MLTKNLEEKWGPELLAVFERHTLEDQNRLVAELDRRYPEMGKDVDAAVMDWRLSLGGTPLSNFPVDEIDDEETDDD